MHCWYVVHCQPASDRRADYQLKRQGFSVLWLRYRHKAAIRGHLCECTKSLFPGYLFVSLDLTEPGCLWRSILGTYGVSGMIMAGEQPAPLPERIAKQLLHRADSEGMVSLEHPLRPGVQVRMLDGPFKDFEGIFEARTGAERVRILLSVFGRTVHTEVPEVKIEPIDGTYAYAYKS